MKVPVKFSNCLGHVSGKATRLNHAHTAHTECVAREGSVFLENVACAVRWKGAPLQHALLLVHVANCYAHTPSPPPPHRINTHKNGIFMCRCGRNKCSEFILLGCKIVAFNVSIDVRCVRCNIARCTHTQTSHNIRYALPSLKALSPSPQWLGLVLVYTQLMVVMERKSHWSWNWSEYESMVFSIFFGT